MKRSGRGNVFVEAIITLPIFLILLFGLLEFGFLMYDWAVLNYATATTAARAAVEGKFSEDLRLDLANFVNQWTSRGSDLNFDYLAELPYTSEETVVVWGTDPAVQVQRGGEIEVGVVYPVRFRTLVVEAMAGWTVQEKNLALKTRAVAASEVFYEE
ncbi:TadE/TadG family type IV pilus assembly protein [Moorellaceae bacterium AZ2]